MVAVPATSYQVYPSEYAYHRDSVYRVERKGANCRNYPGGLQVHVLSSYYIHCDGTPLRLTDSDYGLEQYTPSDYYVWPNETRNSQLLFIFPTRVNLTTITLHYYSDSVRGLPRLRFYTVPDDFNVWDAPTPSYSFADVAAMPLGEESAGRRNISIDFRYITRKILMYKFRSTFSLALSEVEFIQQCCGKPMAYSYYIIYLHYYLSLAVTLSVLCQGPLLHLSHTLQLAPPHH